MEEKTRSSLFRTAEAVTSLSIVIAAYNEEKTLAETVRGVINVLRRYPSLEHEVIILNDGSTDKTGDTMRQLKEEFPALCLLTHDTNQGIARTLEDLFQAATKEYVFDIPGDGEYPPEIIQQVLPLLPTYDIVICKRCAKRYTFYRSVISFLYRALPRVLFSVDLIDPGSVKCRRRIIHDLPVQSKGVFIEAERLISALQRGYTISSVAIETVRRKGGKARGARFPVVFQAALDLLAFWFRSRILRKEP